MPQPRAARFGKINVVRHGPANDGISHHKAMRYFIACLLVHLLASIGYADDDSPVGLTAYVDKNLRKLDDAEIDEFGRAFRALTGDVAEEKKPFESFEPWTVSKFRSGKAHWIFVEVYPGYAIPDVSAVRVHVFDKEWKRLAKDSFPTGYRFFLKEATVDSNEVLQQDLLVVKVMSSGPFLVLPGGSKKPAFEQGDSQTQYYAFIGDRMALIRLEDDEGTLVQNSYRWSTPMKGGAIPKRTRDQWIESLSSKSVADQLATLVWLSGSHLKSSEKRYENVNQESLEDSELFESVRNSDTTRKTLNILQNSKVNWVQEYAHLTVDASASDD